MNESQEMAERRNRRLPRRAVDLNVGILAEGEYFVSKAHEIGEGGLLLSCPKPLVEGQLIVVSYILRGLFTEVTRAVVRNVRDMPDGNQRYGIQFDNLDFEIKRKIRNFVASMASSDKKEKQAM